MIWATVLAGCLGCFLLKLAGWSVPRRWLERPRLQRAAVLLPVPLLAALVVVQAFGGSAQALVLDARAAGLAVGGALVLARAPFLLVVVAAAATAAAVRALA